MQEQNKIDILVNFSRKLPLISNVLLRNISCTGIRYCCLFRCRCCRCFVVVVLLLVPSQMRILCHEFLFLLARCYHDMDRGPLNYLIIPSSSTSGTFSTQILRLIIRHVSYFNGPLSI